MKTKDCTELFFKSAIWSPKQDRSKQLPAPCDAGSFDSVKGGLMVTKPNTELWNAIAEKRVRRWELAAALGISQQSLYRWLYNPCLSQEKQKRIWEALAKIG